MNDRYKSIIRVKKIMEKFSNQKFKKIPPTLFIYEQEGFSTYLVHNQKRRYYR